MAAILAHPEVKPLLSDAHFPVDGTLIKAILKARASMKSFQPKAPPEEDDPGDPPTDAPPRKPDQPHPPETPPMQSKSRNAEVDFKGEKRSDKTDPTKPMRRSPIPTPCFTRNPPARAQFRVSSGRL